MPRLLSLDFLLFLMVPLLAGCAPGRDLPPLPSRSSGEYRLGPGDAVRIITYGEEPLTGPFRRTPPAGCLNSLTGGRPPRHRQRCGTTSSPRSARRTLRPHANSSSRCRLSSRLTRTSR